MEYLQIALAVLAIVFLPIAGLAIGFVLLTKALRRITEHE